MVTFDSDASLLSTYQWREGAPESVGRFFPVTLAVGELDGDAEPEIVAAGGQTLYAFEHDLTPKWAYWGSADTSADMKMALADLDGDGRHEVIAHKYDDLHLFRGDGVELGSLSIGEAGYQGVDIVVNDIDLDGRAEILATGYYPDEWIRLYVIENADGGWITDGDEYPWPGRNHFPGDRNLDGTIPSGAPPHWTVPGHNVWLGLPADGESGMADLQIDVESVCVWGNDCTSMTEVVAYVSNVGLDLVLADVDVVLLAADGTEIAREPLSAPVESGVAYPVEFLVWTADIDGGFEVAIDEELTWAECDLSNNVAVWTEGVCD